MQGNARLAGRLVQLYLGLALYGSSLALLLRSDLGLDPWDVLHQGLSRHSDLAVGTWTIIVGVAVLVPWIPLRQRPGLGTVSNAILLGVAMSPTLDLMPPVESLAVRWVCLIGGILACGVATGAYIGADLGPGPRDGLMTGLAKRGISIRVARTAIEATVLLA